MGTLDLAPLPRSTVRCDRLSAMPDRAARTEPSTQGPSDAIETVADDACRITRAVAGAGLEHGRLAVALKRAVPEALRPRRIGIGGTQAACGQGDAPARVEGGPEAA